MPLGRQIVAFFTTAALVFAPAAQANPLGEAVRHGDVTFERIDGQLRVLQASDRAIIDWESFSIGAGELTEFLQPGSRSAALNRVRGASASTIEGALRANGRVYLINPNGILIGPSGTIDVGGFVASTLDVSDSEFLAGGDMVFAGASEAGIVNLGSISAFDGDVVLIAKTVENAGTIRAPGGTAALAAGNDVLLAESGSERVFVRGASGGNKATGVTNTGNIEANIAELKAHGGNIYGMAVKNEGRVAATGVTKEGGQVFLRANGGPVRTTGTLKARNSKGGGGRILVDSGAEGKTEIGGRVDAKGETGNGGEIVILGREIDVMAGSLVIADGDSGGGTILIGGGQRGKDPAYHNAETVTVGEGATLSANAITNGNGGQIVVFANDSLTFLGNLSATGGREGGNGGFAELSGKNSVTIPNLAGRIDLSALNGQGGTLLFDPIDTSVVAGSGSAIGSPVSQNTLFANDVAVFLNTASLIVETNVLGTGNGDITIQNGVGISWNSAHSLTFNAFRDFKMTDNSFVQANGTGGVTVNAGRSIFLDPGSKVQTAGGSIALNANTGGTAIGVANGITLNNADVTTTDGAITMTAVGNADSVSSNHIGIRLQNGSVVSATGIGSIFLNGAGGEGVDGNIGVSLIDTGTRVETNTGDLMIDGFGSDDASGADNDGIQVMTGAQVLSTGGNITLQGIAGSGTDGLNGVSLLNPGTLVKSVNGSVSIEGTGDEFGATSNIGVLLFQAGVESTNNLVKIEGQGGAGGVSLTGAGSVFTQNGAIDVNGEAVAGNFTGITLNGVSIQATAGGAIHLKGDGNGTGLAISSILASDVLGSGSESVTLESLGGNVTVLGTVNASSLLMRDVTGTGTAEFRLTNMANDVDSIDALGTGTIPRVGGVDFHDANGFQVGANGIAAVGGVKLQSHGALTDTVTIVGPVSSQGGLIDIDGPNILIDSGSLTNLGTGAIDLNAERSILMNNGASASVVDGGLILTANNGTPLTGEFAGIAIEGSSLLTSGLGNISLTGRGGDGANFDFAGVDGIRLISSTISSTSADTAAGMITLTGTGGSGDSRNAGILLEGSATSIQSVNGAITLTGTGGDSDVGAGLGVQMRDDATIHSSGPAGNAATISVTGTGGDIGSNNIGVSLRDFSTGIHSAYGDISITGTGGGDGTGVGNHGVELFYVPSTIESTGTGVGAAKIDITGTGGLGQEDSDGVSIVGLVTVASTDGDVVIKGTGGSGTDGGNQGVNGAGSLLIAASGLANVTMEGQGGVGGDFNEGVRLQGSGLLVQVKDGKLTIDGTGGGNGSIGVGNRGVYVIGSTLKVTEAGDLQVIGNGGQGNDQVDGIQLEGGTLIEVKDGALALEGTAGGTLGFGVIGTNNNGDLRVVGTGSATITGSGASVAGVTLGNPGSMLGGSNASFVTVTSLNGDLDIAVPTTADGDVTFQSPTQTRIGGEVQSIHGNIQADGNEVFVNAPFTASNGIIGFQIDDLGASASGTIHVNNLLSASGLSFSGGGGAADTVTYSGYSGAPIVFFFDDLNSIEFVEGPPAAGDEFVGPSVGGDFDFNGPNSFTVNGVSVTKFENVTGGADDDTFSFNAGSGLSGHLNGGGGANELNYANFGTAVIVNLGTGEATAIEVGFSNIQNFTGSPNIDTVTGPGSGSVYTIFAPDSVEVSGIQVTGFENLIGGPNDDQFIFQPGGSLTGYLDGGLATNQNTLDYSSFGAPVTVNFGTLPNASATAIGGGFLRISDFIGSAGTNDSFTGPNVGLTYNLSAPDEFSTPTFAAAGFENLAGGAAGDTFIVSPGASLTGQLSGGGGGDTLNYASFGGPVTVNVGTGQASGFGSIAALETFIGSTATDTFATNGNDDVFDITANNAGTVNGATTFSSFEVLNSGIGNDRFNFLNQATVALVDGGPGTDTLFLNDSNLGGVNTYTITSNSISRNPTYNFANMEIVQLLLGPGNDTVNSGFFGFRQIIDGGRGTDTLNLPGVLSLDEGNPIQNVSHLNFESPRDNPVADLGDILQIQLDQVGNFDFQDLNDFFAENHFNDPNNPGLMGQLAGLGGAFAAATTLVGQAVVIAVDGNSYLIVMPFSLDGSGLTPSNLALAALAESLGVAANLELAEAIGYTSAIYLVRFDGAYAIDLGGAPVDPSVIASLQESLSLAAARELFDALGMPLAVFVTGTDGAISIDLDGAAPGQPVLIVLTEQLSDAALAELNTALGN